MAFPLCDEERQEHMIAANDTHEIDIEGPLPFLDWNILGKTATHRRNIVHDDMHCAKTHQRLSLQLLESEWLSHIACVRFGVAALLPNMLCDHIQLGLSAPRQKNGYARFSQRDRGGPAYPTRSDERRVGKECVRTCRSR